MSAARMSGLWRGGLMLLAAMLLIRCSPVEGHTPIPDDGKDDAAAIQAAIDAQASAGDGIVQLEAGTYNISRPILLRDGVTLAGRGVQTHLTNIGLNDKSNWSGVAVFAGNIAPVSYSGVLADGYRGQAAVREGARAVSVTNCEPSIRPGPGAVVWLSSAPASKARRDAPVSRYGEMNLVTSVQGCTLAFDSPVAIPERERIWVHWADGSTKGPVGVPQRTIRGAGLRDLRISSANSQGLVVSGCYRCRFTDLTFERTRRLIGVQGSRGSLYEGIRGTFIERGLEFAMYATENIVRDVAADYAHTPGWSPRPAIRFGEFSNNNLISNVRLRLGDAYLGAVKIRFDESYGNRLEDIEIDVPAEDDMRRAMGYLGEGNARIALGMASPGTSLRNVALCWSAGNARRCAAVQ